MYLLIAGFYQINPGSFSSWPSLCIATFHDESSRIATFCWKQSQTVTKHNELNESEMSHPVKPARPNQSLLRS